MRKHIDAAGFRAVLANTKWSIYVKNLADPGGHIHDEAALADALDGKPLAHKVNLEVWPAYARRFASQFGFSPTE